MIKHHPDLSNLMSCAAGSQPEAIAAVMASHVSMCATCSRELAHMEEIGAALFEAVAPADVQRPAPVVAARAAEADSLPPAVATPVGDVPAPLVAVLGGRLEDIKWKWLAPGVWHWPVRLSEGAKGNLRLVKVAPGKALPEHGHGGSELTLLLEGSYRDRLGEYRRGDVADVDDSVDHKPIADPEVGCICLVATDGKARYKGLLARLIQPFTGV